jgi:pimeloyl-ACP methyl ester carboxylesterase
MCVRYLAENPRQDRFDAALDVLGHSMGGMTAAVVATLAAGVVRRVILADPTFLSPQRQREVCDSDVAEQHRRLLLKGRGDVLADVRSRHIRRRLRLWNSSSALGCGPGAHAVSRRRPNVEGPEGRRNSGGRGCRWIAKDSQRGWRAHRVEWEFMSIRLSQPSGGRLEGVDVLRGLSVLLGDATPHSPSFRAE